MARKENLEVSETLKINSFVGTENWNDEKGGSTRESDLREGENVDTMKVDWFVGLLCWMFWGRDVKRAPHSMCIGRKKMKN